MRNNYNHSSVFLGDDVPLSQKKRKRVVDHRQLSLRWMFGVLATGVSSLVLMGGALTGALDGQQKLARPGEALAISQNNANNASANSAFNTNRRGERVIGSIAPLSESAGKRELSVATLAKQGDTEVIQKRKFVHVKANLAVAADPSIQYPKFKALSVFADKQQNEADISASSIYGAEVDSPVTVTTTPLTSELIGQANNYQMSFIEAEQIVRENASALEATDVQLSAVAYISPALLDFDNQNPLLNSKRNITVLGDNVSTFDMPRLLNSKWYDDTLFSVDSPTEIETALIEAGFAQGEAQVLAPEFSQALRSKKIETRHSFKIELEKDVSGQVARPMRISAWEDGQHLLTYARRDDGILIKTPRPIGKSLAKSGDDSSAPLPATLPSVYDGIYRALLTRDLPQKVAKRLISIFASDIDFKTRVRATDKIELFYTGDEESDDLDVLHARIQLGNSDRRYYRFVTPDDGKVDYYDKSGKSARKFLIRKPLPAGKFRSGFGMRRHPVLKYSRMHSGVDWSAPRGTPIIAAGSGKVTQAKWAGGYGRQTLIQHANGYVTSYSHQTRFARGIKAGAYVQQGQVIGYVGSTGLSTGPHLHYEVIVNGRKVNPMKIRLPQGRVLKGDVLAQFLEEKSRIDELLMDTNEQITTASILQ